MTLETFFEKFDLFSDAPGAVTKMRELVLELAIQGRLCAPETDDIPPEKILRQVQEEKVALQKKGFLRRVDKPETAFETSASLNVPSHWKLVSLSALCVSVTDGDHLPPPKAETGVPFLVISDVRWGNISFEGCRFVSMKYYESLDWTRKPKENDILYTLVGSFGIPVVIHNSQPFCVQRHIGILRPSSHVVLGYLNHVLASRFVYQQSAKIATGIAQKTVPLTGLRRIAIPLPPLAEQKRIVAKVDELMALCDRLEAQQREREEQASNLSRAALARFAEAPTPANLDFLFHSSFNIPPADLRKSILTLAVQGKLLPQDPNDELTEGGAVQGISLSLQDDQSPFEIPSVWNWKNLGAIAQIERGGSPRPIKDYLTDDPNGLNWIKIGDTEKGGKYITSTEERIRPEGLTKTRRVYPGDFLLTNSMSFGRPYISKIEGCIHDGWLRIHPPDEVTADYLYYLLSSSYVSDFFKKAAAGAVVQNLNADKVRKLMIPVPPLAEQRRIVAKVDELMALVDALETQLTTARTIAANLLAAAVVELTQGP